MRALVLKDFDSSPEVVDLDLPEPAEGEVRVRVHAASVNGFDLAVASGYLNGMMEHRFPVVLGKDFAGEIDAVGDGVTDYAVGDRVFGVVTKPFLGDGSFAEYVTVPVAVGLAKIPDALDYTEAASLGLAGSAAIDATDAAALAPGQLVLIAGATGGVGQHAVQIAARAGATVIATAHGAAEVAQVTGIGAAETVDYTGDVAAQVRALHPDGVDVVLHFAGPAEGLVGLVKQGGHLVSTLGPQEAPEGVTTTAIMATPSRETLDRLAGAHEGKHTTLTIQKIYALDDTASALADFGAGTLGKLVVSID